MARNQFGGFGGPNMQQLMRQAQKDYFAYRTRDLLVRSKELEREVDNDLVTIAKMFQ